MMCVTAAAAKSLQLCPTLCDPIDGSLPGSPVPGILHARTLEWVAVSFSNAWTWKVKVKSLSRVPLFVTPWTAAYPTPPKKFYWITQSQKSPHRPTCWLNEGRGEAGLNECVLRVIYLPSIARGTVTFSLMLWCGNDHCYSGEEIEGLPKKPTQHSEHVLELIEGW